MSLPFLVRTRRSPIDIRHFLIQQKLGVHHHQAFLRIDSARQERFGLLGASASRSSRNRQLRRRFSVGGLDELMGMDGINRPSNKIK